MNAAPGWYALPENPAVEQYFNGAMWIGSRRPRQDETLDFPELPTPPTIGSGSSAPRPVRGWSLAGGLLWLLAAVTAIAAIVACYQLVKHGVPTDCDDSGCYGTDYPYKGAGYAVLLGGLLQAVVTAVIAQLCIAFDDLKRAGSKSDS